MQDVLDPYLYQEKQFQDLLIACQHLYSLCRDLLDDIFDSLYSSAIINILFQIMEYIYLI